MPDLEKLGDEYVHIDKKKWRFQNLWVIFLVLGSLQACCVDEAAGSYKWIALAWDGWLSGWGEVYYGGVYIIK